MDEKYIYEKVKDIVNGMDLVLHEYVDETKLRIDFVTIFAHSKGEYKSLTKTATKLGKKVYEHN